MITILDLAKHRGAKEVDGSISGGEVERTGLPFMGGCEGCGATIACYNSYPSKTGYIRCPDCIYEDIAYATVEEANMELFEGEMPCRLG